MIHAILEEINADNSTKRKTQVLQDNKDDVTLQRVIKLCYDRVAYTYGVSVEQISKFSPEKFEHPINLNFALAGLVTELSTRNKTGHAALQYAANLIGNLPAADAELIKKIINRDLRINIGKTQFKKVWPDLLIKPSYMRCGVYSEKTAEDITFPAMLQLKADGTYREFAVENGEVTARSRQGEESEYPLIFAEMKEFPEGVYCGELTVRASENTMLIIYEKLAAAQKKGKDTEELESIIEKYKAAQKTGEEYIFPRAVGNGMIKSSNPPHEDIIAEFWDYITLEEYAIAATKNKENPCKIPYEVRFRDVLAVTKDAKTVRPIPYMLVNNLTEALQQTSDWMNEGFEGAILKDIHGVFKDGTSKHQLKLKLEIDCEMRIVGFQDGRKGTKREGKVGSVIFQNDELTIKGRCSGFSEDILDDMTANPEKYIEKIVTVQFNDLSRAEGKEYYALSHPRYIEVRDDKDETDTLEKVLDLRKMAMLLK